MSMMTEKITNLNPSMRVRPALCLDFDGTIRRSKSGETFIKNYKDIELIPYVETIIQRYRLFGWLIFGITNQAGVAHGFKLPMEIELEIEETMNLFNPNPFHIVKSCYHDSKGSIEPYCHRSLCRKPDIGLLALMEAEAFQAKYIVDWDNSLFVGDRPEDEQCAKNAGIKFHHIDEFINMTHKFEIQSEK